MANHTYSKGLLYKKTLNSSGEVTGSVPLLLKTLGSLVIMSDGTDAETAISTAISNMVTPDETTIVTGQDGITISVKKSTSAEIDEILGDVPTSHTWEGYYTKSETEALIDAVDDKISQSGIETALGYTPIPTTAKGSNNGVAELDATGKVPASQLPSYVDDVIESATYAALPETGESGKIYVTLNDDKTYRWSGSAYVEISASLALGETSSTAYRGDRGKTAYDHSQAAHARTDATNAAIVSGKLNINGTATNIGDFKAVSTAASQGLTDTEKSNALANIGAVPNSDFVVVENNIVYALGKTGRNQFNIDMTTLKYWNTAGTWNGNVYTQGGLTFTFNNDGTIDVSGTATERVNIVLDVYYPLNTESGYRFHDLGGLVLSGCPTGGAWNKYSLSLQMTDSPWTSAAQDTGSGAIIDKSVLPSNVRTVAFYLSIYASYPTSSLTFKPMFCTQEDWSVTHDYTPYQGKSNYDLTQLQSEDRASLVEIVDSGAKNILQIPAGTKTSLGVTFTSDSNTGVISLSGTYEGGDCYFDIGQFYFSSGFPRKFVVFANSTENQYACMTVIPHRTNGTYDSTIVVATNRVIDLTSSTFDAVLIRANCYASDGASFTDQKVYPMICTKAAFGVSTKFVPYIKSNSQLTTELGSVKTVLEAIL